jgi:hypothetical protein
MRAWRGGREFEKDRNINRERRQKRDRQIRERNERLELDDTQWKESIHQIISLDNIFQLFNFFSNQSM